MPRLTSIQTVLLMSSALLLLVSAQDYRTPRFDLSKYTLDYFALALGFFDNLKQTQSGNSDIPRVTLKQVSVDVPALRPAPVYYIEVVVDGKVDIMLLGAVYERPGPTIEVKIYNFTNPSLFKPVEFDVSTLYDLKKEELRGGNCTAIFKRLTRTAYVGSFLDCEGNNPSFDDTFECNRLTVVPGDSKTLYIFDRAGNRFPTVGFPDTYDRICGQPRQVTRRYK